MIATSNSDNVSLTSHMRGFHAFDVSDRAEFIVIFRHIEVISETTL